MLSESEAIRAGIIQGKAKQPRKRPRPSRAGAEEHEPSPYRCGPCGMVLASYAAAEKHLTAEHGHGRLEAVYPEADPPGGFHLDEHEVDDYTGLCPRCGRG